LHLLYAASALAMHKPKKGQEKNQRVVSGTVGVTYENCSLTKKKTQQAGWDSALKRKPLESSSLQI
jgi:hypothetical protein